MPYFPDDEAYHECPVCAREWGTPIEFHDICPSCGIQFGYQDAHPDYRADVHRAWRLLWIDNNQQPLPGSGPTIAQLMERLEKERARGADDQQ